MTKKWHRFRNPWDREYAKRGVLWRGIDDATWLQAWVEPGVRVLEVGCGDGKFLAGLARAGYAPLGVDFAPHALRLVVQRADWPVLAGDVRWLPVRDGAFPVVAARYVLGALLGNDRALAARELQRATAPAGLLVLEEFTKEDFRFGQGRPVEAATFERNRGLVTHYFKASELESLFPRAVRVSVDLLRGVQRTAEGPKVRARCRLLLRA